MRLEKQNTTSDDRTDCDYTIVILGHKMVYYVLGHLAAHRKMAAVAN